MAHHIPHQLVSQLKTINNGIVRNSLIRKRLTAGTAFCRSAWNRVTSDVHSAVFRRKAKSLLRGSIKIMVSLTLLQKVGCFGVSLPISWLIGLLDPLLYTYFLAYKHMYNHIIYICIYTCINILFINPTVLLVTQLGFVGTTFKKPPAWAKLLILHTTYTTPVLIETIYMTIY